MINRDIYDSMLNDAAKATKHSLNISNKPVLGVVLGTGLNKSVKLENSIHFPLKDLKCFESLYHLKGHPRELVYGYINGIPMLTLNGRIHLNELPGDNVEQGLMVRMQIEIMIKLGIKMLITTCAAGSLSTTKNIQVGDVVLIDGFLSLFTPAMPHFVGEFVSPENILANNLGPLVKKIADQNIKKPRKTVAGIYAMLRGPQFEGIKVDKRALATMGADCVGMSVYPECSIAALHKISTIALAFITNDDKAKHSHEKNLKTMLNLEEQNSNFLTQLATKLADTAQRVCL